MKKILPVLLILLLFAPSAHAGDPLRKLSRGFVNILTSPLEYGVQFQATTARMNGFMAIPYTLVTGTGAMLVRIGSGVYDIVTFPIPFPEGYKAWITPETPIEAFQDVSGGGGKAGVFGEDAE
jgi:putative exosortase-associated protein (TIGR04073 family)